LPDDGLGLLVKIIDARQNLSIQLHPDDATAERLGLPCGKAEAWYVLEAAPGARLWVGLEAGVDRERLLADARSGRDVSELLNVIRPTPGTVINVPPGTVHAIGAGLVLLEVQQVSDTTFRLFDWNRQPARELHLEEAGLALREDPAAGLVLPAPFRERSPGEPRCMLLTPLFELAAVRAPGTTSQPAASAELWFAERGDTLIRHGGQELLLRQGQFCKISGPVGTIELVPAVEQAVTELIRVRTT
jgi:mannose-6-phosphate isomerase